MRSVEKTTPGPFGVGTIWLWHVVEESVKRSTPFELEVTEYARPNRLGSITRMTRATIVGGLIFTHDPGGTTLSRSWISGPTHHALRHGHWGVHRGR